MRVASSILIGFRRLAIVVRSSGFKSRGRGCADRAGKNQTRALTGELAPLECLSQSNENTFGRKQTAPHGAVVVLWVFDNSVDR